MATPWVNPTAFNLLDQSQYGINGDGGVDRLHQLFDWSGTQWAGLANPYTNDSDGGATYTGDAPLADALRSGGYQFMRGGDPVGNGEYRWVQDAQGNIVAEPQYTSLDDPAFQAAMLAAMGFAGGSAAGLAGTGGAGTSAADLAAIDSAMGAGGFNTTAAGGALANTGGFLPELGYGFATDVGGGIGAEYGLLSGAGADTAAAGLAGVASPLTSAGAPMFGSSLGAAGLSNLPNLGAQYGDLAATNAADLVSPGSAATGGSMLTAPGAALGSALGGNMDWLKALLIGGGALAGSREQPGAQSTQQSKTDPRIDPYLYGDNGILKEMQNWYAANKGPNANQTAGWNTQLGLLNDPNTMGGLKGLMTGAQGLLSGPIAGNGYMARRG